MRVQAEPPEGTTGTVAVNNDPVLELEDGQEVYVLPRATILDQRPGGDISSVEDIMPGDKLFYHGLGACTGDDEADFYAFIVQVVEP